MSKQKFKVGDKVKVVKKIKNEPFSGGFKIGIKGIITCYSPGGSSFSYEVKRLTQKQRSWFSPRELEKC